jgi:hypothetical protein
VVVAVVGSTAGASAPLDCAEVESGSSPTTQGFNRRRIMSEQETDLLPQ